MYDEALRVALLERVGEVVRDLMNQPGKVILVAGGIALLVWWVTRR